jgi:hypothetical protein
MRYIFGSSKVYVSAQFFVQIGIEAIVAKKGDDAAEDNSNSIHCLDFHGRSYSCRMAFIGSM